MANQHRNFLFTIFTPVYNGEKTIHRVFSALKESKYRRFEWIIVNDGSTDRSDEIIKDFIRTTDWDITYLNEEQNRGKHIAWNRAAQIAKGEIFITLDCDDSFVPEALDFLNEKWNEYYDDKSIYGIDTLCVDPETGETSGTSFPCDGIKSCYDELYNRYGVRGEKWNTFRTEYMKKYPFPEISCSYYTECYLLYSLGERYYSISFNKVLRHYYQEPASLMHLRKIKISHLYMVIHYQHWHLGRMGFHLLRVNPKEFYRCAKELCRTFVIYLFMRVIRAKEIVRY